MGRCWEGNRRSGVALAMPVIYSPWADNLRKGDQHPPSLLMGYCTFTFTLSSTYLDVIVCIRVLVVSLSPAKRINRLRCRLGGILRGPKESCVGATWRIRWIGRCCDTAAIRAFAAISVVTCSVRYRLFMIRVVKSVLCVCSHKTVERYDL